MYTNKLTAEELIRYIANDYVELSHEKVRIQRDEYIKICRNWISHNNTYTNSTNEELDNNF